MENFEYLVPTKVVFGKGTEGQAGELVHEFGGTKAMIMWSGDYVRTTGLLDRIHASFDEAGVGYVDFDDIVPNPRLSAAKRALAICREQGVDFLLPVGGGSPIDTAKCVAYGLANDFELEDLYLGKVEPKGIAPLGAISTLAGTGSETSNSSVINVDTLGGDMLKLAYDNDMARPLFAIMDPELTYSVPAYQTASAGSDIMMHTMERYFTNTEHVELTDAISEGLMRTVRCAVPEALADPRSYAARANLLWAGSLSHCGLTGTGRQADWACHAMEHQLGALFDCAHGAGLCAIWSTWAKYVIKANPERFAQFAVNVFGVVEDFHDPLATGLRGIEAWDQWCRSIGMPTSLTELGVKPTDEQVHEMAVNAVDAHGGVACGSFMPLSVEDVENIYRNAQ